jgi:hypothetical protein
MSKSVRHTSNVRTCLRSWPADIANCIISERSFHKDNERIDVKGLGRIMMELIKNKTCIDNADSIELQYLEKWRESGIKDFLSKTATSTVEIQMQLRDSSDWC